MSFKPPHQVDSSGYPVDPELRQLQRRLGDLAAELREVSRGVDRQDEIVGEYHDIMRQLYLLGWDDILDVEAELPEHLMPVEYKLRHPHL